MKIETTTYSCKTYSKKDIRLNIGLSIKKDTEEISSSVEIQLTGLLIDINIQLMDGLGNLM